MALETEQWRVCGTQTAGDKPMAQTKRLDTEAVKRSEF
jgi:hypothetical protein